MKVLDPGIIVGSSGLLSVEEKDGSIKITLKNKTTLDIIPVVGEDGSFEGFEYNYMTAQQNRKINSLKEKMAKIQSEMEGIISADPGEEEDVDDEDLEDIEEESEDSEDEE
jgi:hypothetical protein